MIAFFCRIFGLFLTLQIHLHKNHYEETGRCLDIGLSNNFKVREHPLYHLIRAKLQKNSKQIAASIQTLQKATELPSFKASAFLILF